MKLKVLSLVMRVPEADFFVKVAKYLSKYDLQMEFVAGHESAEDVFEKANIKFYSLHKRVKQIDSPEEVISSEKTRILQDKFKIDNIRSVYMREKLNLRRFNEDEMLRKTMNYLEAMDNIIEKCSPDVIIQETGDFIAPISLFYAARSRNLNHIFIEPAMFPKRSTFVFNSLYADIPSDISKSPCSDEESDFVNNYLRSYLDDKAVLMPAKDKPFFKDMSLRSFLNKSNFKKLGRKLYNKYILRKSEEYNAIAWHCLHHFLRAFRRKLLNRLYITKLPDSPYIYFPLHVPLDLQLTTRCTKYLDQLYLIEYISRCIPFGYSLLIKEHPASIGAYSYSGIKNILNRYSHVKIVHPKTNSYHIIDNSKCIITINSKVGVEAILQQKLVITLGPTFYRNKGLTIDVYDLKDLSESINNGLACERLDANSVRKFLTTVYRWSWKGELFENSAKNIKAFSESLIESAKEINDYCNSEIF